jgi:hypothetical protein
MPRYFFHIRNDEHVDDEEGTELPDVAAARDKALDGVLDLICESVRKGRLNLDDFIVVTDEQGHEVLKLQFREAFELKT